MFPKNSMLFNEEFWGLFFLYNISIFVERMRICYNG